jgi:hypothetical protein
VLARYFGLRHAGFRFLQDPAIWLSLKFDLRI